MKGRPRKKQDANPPVFLNRHKDAFAAVNFTEDEHHVTAAGQPGHATLEIHLKSRPKRGRVLSKFRVNNNA